jgi:hypothetical protein
MARPRVAPAEKRLAALKQPPKKPDSGGVKVSFRTKAGKLIEFTIGKRPDWRKKVANAG